MRAPNPVTLWTSLGIALLGLGFALAAFSIALVLLTGEVHHGQ